jgi:hypothetical protein
MYEHVGGFDVPSGEIANLYDRACVGNSEAGCLNLGLLLQGEGQGERAAELFERTCTAGLMSGCHHLGVACERGDGVTKDVSRAIELYGEACEGRELDSCLALFSLFTEGEEMPVDLARARSSADRAIAIRNEGCQAGSNRDCEEAPRLRARLALQLQAAAAR